jgi:hypothetical protein
MPAAPAPDCQAQVGLRRVAERHRWGRLKFHTTRQNGRWRQAMTLRDS